MAGYSIGVEDLYFAKLLSDTKAGATYDVPVEIAKLTSVGISPQVANAVLYANDRQVANINETTGAEVTIGVDDLTAEAQELVLGQKRNEDGVMIYDDKAIAPDGALLFRSKLHNGAYRYVALLKGSFAANEDQFQTKGEGIELSGKEITAKFVLREFDGAYRFQVDSNDEGVNQEVITNWFSAVYNPTNTQTP